MISSTGLLSCADCHVPAHGYSDPRAKSLDVVGVTAHHTQTLIDVADAKAFHWHGEKSSIRELVRDRAGSFAVPYYEGGPGVSDEDEPPVITPGSVVSFPSRSGPLKPADAFVPTPSFAGSDRVLGLRQADRYGEAFIAAFGTSRPTSERVEAAVEAYCLTIRSGSSPFDRFAAGDPTALSASAQRGLELFRGKAGCATCHTMTGERPAFTDQALHDLHLEKALASAPRTPRKPGFSAFVTDKRDREAFEAAEERLHQWKTPTLRDVARRGPYFHTGLATTLEEAVRFFRPPDATPGIVPADKPWTDGQVADVVAFLRSLSSDARPGLSEATWVERSGKQRLRFVDASGNPLRGLDVVLAPAGDVLPLHRDAAPMRRKTGDDGMVRYETPLCTHLRVVCEGGLEPIGGPMVPDSCRSAEIKLPIRGRALLALTLPAGVTAPETLLASHPGATRFPDRKRPATILRRESVAEGSKGTVVAKYAAPMRTDVPAEVAIEIPGRASSYNVTFRRDQFVPLEVAPSAR